MESDTGGLRFGRIFAFGNRHIVSPGVGFSYLDVDSVVEGVASFDSVFPDSDDFPIRYSIHQETLRKWSTVAGLNIGFKNGTSLLAEYNRNSGGGERIVLSASVRF